MLMKLIKLFVVVEYDLGFFLNLKLLEIKIQKI